MNKSQAVSVSNKQIIQLAAPISLALLIPQINFLTNTAFLGRYGERELGVNGITGVFYLILAMIGYGLSSGMQIQMARRVGEKDNNGLAQIFTNGIMLSMLFSLGLMMISLWMAPLIFSYSLNDGQNVALSVQYTYIRVWGLPFFMATQLFNSFFISINRSRVLIYGSVTATALNIIFDYLLIFGKCGLPQLGFAGAAIASVISEVAFCVVVMSAFFYQRLYKVYPVFRYLHFDWELSKRSLAVASPLIVQFMFSIGGWLIFFFFIENLGGMALPASQMLRSIFGIVGVGTWAFATTCNTMVSKIIGQGRQAEVMGLIAKICKLSFIFAVIMCVVLLSFSTEFLSLYRDDPALVAYAVPSLRVIVVATLIMSLSTVIFNGVVGTGNTLVNLTMEVTSVGIYLVYCYFIIKRWHSPLYMCWGSEFIYWTSLFIISFAYLKSGRWKGKKI